MNGFPSYQSWPARGFPHKSGRQLNPVVFSYSYQVAGVPFYSQFPISALQMLAVPFARRPGVRIQCRDRLPEPVAGCGVFDGRVALGAGVYHLRVHWLKPWRCMVQAQRVPVQDERGEAKKNAGWQSFSVSADEILCQAASNGRHTVADELILLGPVMAVCLAMRQVFLLHASAVLVDGCLCVFLAESGTGKSTLAAAVAGKYGTQVADDIMPVRLDDEAVNGLVVDARFPQWKLSADQQWRDNPAWKRVHWFFLRRLASARTNEPVLRTLGQTESLLKLLRHGVATRLFTAPLLKQHQQLCQRAAAWPGFDVCYHHSQRGLAAAVRAVVDSVRQGVNG